MHAGVVSLQVRPDMVEEAIRTYRDSVLPGLKEMRGFDGGYVLTDPATGKGRIIGLWRTQENAEGFQSGGAFIREQAAKFEDVLAETPS